MSSIVKPLCKLVEDLAKRVDELEDQVHDLQLALQLDKTANVQTAFEVSDMPAQILVTLSAGFPRNKEQIHAALYFNRRDDKIPDIKVIDTMICKLRKTVEEYGIEIETIHGSGYQLVAGLDIVRAAMEYGIADAKEAAARRKRDREWDRQRRLRAERGCVDRETYESRLPSRERPWEKLGISRRTWYYRRKCTGGLDTNDNSPVQGGIAKQRAA